MGKARRIIWENNQRKSLTYIYTLVLKHGWNIRLDYVTPEGIHVFNLDGEDPTNKQWDSDWQFHELSHFQRRVTLTWDPKYDPYTDDSGEWMVR